MAETKDELPVVGHLHSNGDFCLEAAANDGSQGWPVDLVSKHAAQSRINALLEEVEKYKSALVELLAAKEERHAAERRFSAELPNADKLGGEAFDYACHTYLNKADERVQASWELARASLSSGRSGSGEASNG